MRMGRSGKRRIVTIGPFSATGARTTLTRSPFASLASTMGEDSLTTLLQDETICCTTPSSFSFETNVRSVRSTLPSRSINMSSGPLIMISVTVGSSSSSWRISRRLMELNSSCLIRFISTRVRVPALFPSVISRSISSSTSASSTLREKSMLLMTASWMFSLICA